MLMIRRRFLARLAAAACAAVASTIMDLATGPAWREPGLMQELGMNRLADLFEYCSWPEKQPDYPAPFADWKRLFPELN
jgi:hypothetical protein